MQCDFRDQFDDEEFGRESRSRSPLFGSRGSYRGSLASSRSSEEFGLRGGVTTAELRVMSNEDLDQRLDELVCYQQSRIGGAGLGLFFTRKIAKDTIIGYYKGEGHINKTVADQKRIDKLNQNYLTQTVVNNKKYVIDASNPATSNALRYANDPRNEPEQVNIKFVVYTPLTIAELVALQDHKYPRVYAVTTQDVDPTQEAYVAYGSDWWEDYDRKVADLYLGAAVQQKKKKKSKKRRRSASRESSRSQGAQSQGAQSQGAQSQGAQSEADEDAPRKIKTKGYVSIPTYAFRKNVPSGCPAWEELCTQDNMYMVKERVRGGEGEQMCKCLVYQNGDATMCSHRPKGQGCNRPSHEYGDETKSNGELYRGKDLRMTFIDLEREGRPTIPACGCYKDTIHKEQARLRQQRKRAKGKGQVEFGEDL